MIFVNVADGGGWFYIGGMEKATQQYLLGVAKAAIMGGAVSEACDDPVLREKRGVFVTLSEEGGLRGCIGNIMPEYPLGEAVMRNARAAAFEDSRFEPVREDEFEVLEIEISVLSVPVRVAYEGEEDLIEKVRGKGVVIELDGHVATYLPQVWEELPEPVQFLSSLCMKAGLEAGEWKRGELEVKVYEVEKF